eukprot:3911901-Amphidinium_carterae.1
MPAKAAMRAITERDPSAGTQFVPLWKETRVLLDNKECITWRINVESGVITLCVQPEHQEHLQRSIMHHINALLQGAPSKGGKGEGKGKQKSKWGAAMFEGPLR